MSSEGINGSGGYKVPVLDGKNFALWKKQILLVLKVKKLTSCLKQKTYITVDTDGDVKTEASYSEDDELKTLTIINGSLDQSVQLKVVSCETAWETWERLHQIYENKTPANVAKIFEQYYSYKKMASDDMSAHISKVEALAIYLEEVGEKQSDISIMSRLLYSLPNEYGSLREAWESVHPDHQTKRNLISRLLAHESSKPGRDLGNTAEVALVAGKPKEARFSQGSDDRRKRVKCFNCGKMGHYKRDCRVKNQSSDRAPGQSVALVLNCGERSDKWVIDSGASRHTCCRRDWFRNFRAASEKLQVGNEEWVEATGCGSVFISCDVGGGKKEDIELKDVLYMPKMSYNLFSTVRAASNGATVMMNKLGCKVMHNGRLLALGEIDKSMGVCVIKGETLAGVLMLVSTRRTIDEWHQTLGHVDSHVISEMANNGVVDGLEIIQKQQLGCAHCAEGKGTRASHTRSTSFEPSEVGDRVDVDLIGPMAESLGGNKYLIVAIDTYSSYSWVCPIKSKADVCANLQSYIGQFEARSGKRIKVIQADNGSEFNNERVRTLLAVEHIELKFSSPYTPEQNGVAERNNRVIIETIRTMLAQSGMPLELWGEAATTAAYLRNRVPRRGKKLTPYQLFVGRKPFVGHLVPFGTPVQSLINDRRLGKFEPKTEPGIIVGFTARANTYRVYLNQDGCKIKQTCDVIFRPHTNYADISIRSQSGSTGGSNFVTVPGMDSQTVVERKRALDEFFDELNSKIGGNEGASCDDSPSKTSEIYENASIIQARGGG